MHKDQFYAPFLMPAGYYIYGAAAFNHRVKACGGPTPFAYQAVQIMDALIAQQTPASNGTVVPFRRAAA